MQQTAGARWTGDVQAVAWFGGLLFGAVLLRFGLFCLMQMAQQVPEIGTSLSLTLYFPSLWWGPLPYILAWLLVSMPSVPQAIIGAASLAAAGYGLAWLSSMIFTGVNIVSPSSAPFAFAGLSILSKLEFLVLGGFMLHWLHGRLRPQRDVKCWRRIHAGTMTVAGLAIALSVITVELAGAMGWSFFLSNERFHFSWLPLGIQIVLHLSFTWHGWASWRQFRLEGEPLPSRRRALTLMAVSTLFAATSLLASVS